MAFLFKHPKSQFWYAGWKDAAGKRVNRSTAIPAKHQHRRQAQKVADEYEAASRSAKTAKQVRQTLIELQKEILGEEKPTATAKEFADRFIEMKKGEAAPASVKEYRRALDGLIQWAGERANEDVGAFVASDFVQYRNHMLTRVKASTANKDLKTIKAMFRLAHAEGLAPENPLDSLKIGRGRTSGIGAEERQAFTLDELRLVLETSTAEWRSMSIFGLYTGQRLGDLASLRWSSIDLVRNEVRFLTRKTAHPILIPIAAPLKAHILKLDTPDKPDAFVHPALAETFERSGSGTLSNQFSSILASCGLRPKVSHRKKGVGRSGKRQASLLSFHSLRATAVTLMHEAGVPASMVEQWVGHNSKDVNRRYVKHGREALDLATSKLPNVL